MARMRTCVLVTLFCALAGPASSQVAPHGSVLAANGVTRYRDGVVLVGFVNGLTPAQQNGALANVAMGNPKHLGFGVYLVDVGAGRVQGAIQSLKARNEIRFAEPDYENKVQGSPTPTDPLFPQQWALNNTGQVVNDPFAEQGHGTPGADIKALTAWKVTTGSPSIVIAVLDTGVQYTHPDLAPNIWNNPGNITLLGLTQPCAAGTHGYNAVAAYPSGSVTYSDPCDPMDDDPLTGSGGFGGHGTKIAGIIGATTNSGQGVAGVNWSTTILPIKWTSVDGTGWNSTLIGAINWVVQLKSAGINIRIINDSATWPSPNLPGGADAGAFSQGVLDAINAAGSVDILFVTPSGNNNQDITPGTGTELRYPCDYRTSNMICVAATNNTDTLWIKTPGASGSNYSTTSVDLAAPGVDIVSTNRTSGYEILSGTSVAAPYVSGAAALVLSTNQSMTVSSLKSTIRNNLDPLTSLATYTATSGRLNACKALPGCSAAAVSPTNTTPPAVTGLPVFGSVLGAWTGLWAGLPDGYTYQWQRCAPSCVDIPGATSAVYPVLASADIGSKLAVKVTVTNTSGTAALASAQFGPITAASSPFTLTSTVQDGQSISATPNWQITPSQGVNFVQFYIDGALKQTVSGSGPYSYTPSALSLGSHVLGVRALSTDNRRYAFYGATVNVVPLSITPTSLPNGTVGVAYSATLAGVGGQTPYVSAALTGSLPAGLSLNLATGLISGTPTTAGTSSFSVSLTDSSATTVTQPLSITVFNPLRITPTSLPSGTVGVAYSATLAGSGGQTPYVSAALTGSLPAGLSLNLATGLISGTPTTAGTSSFSVSLTDSSATTVTQPLSITVYAPLRITPTSLPAGAVGAAYSVTLAGSGGKTPYVSASMTGTLPAGLSLNLATGLLSGTPTTAGTSNFSVSLTDGNGVTVTQPLSITVYAPLRITPTSLPDGTVGVAYSVTLAGSGGKTPYVSASMTGTLPAGLSLNLATGLLSGTPTTAGTSNFSVSLTDGNGVTVTQPLSTTIH